MMTAAMITTTNAINVVQVRKNCDFLFSVRKNRKIDGFYKPLQLKTTEWIGEHKLQTEREKKSTVDF